MRTGGFEDRREPQRVETKVVNGVKLFGDTPQVATKYAMNVFGLQPGLIIATVEPVHKDLINTRGFGLFRRSGVRVCPNSILCCFFDAGGLVVRVDFFTVW